MSPWKNFFPWMQREAPADKTVHEENQPPRKPPRQARPAKADAGESHSGQDADPASRQSTAITSPPDLARLGSLTAPHTPDPFGQPAPAPSPEAVRLSLELADMTYTLDITPWMAAGWRDFSFQIDNVLESGPLPEASSRISTPEDGVFQQLASLHRMRRAQAALRARNPLTQVMAAFRQREGSDTVKAVCMAHPLPGGKQLIAIGFMGTGKRFYDWFSNFRFSDEEGFHKGFSQLSRHFEAAADGIFFPETAAAMGLAQLTLSDILSSLRSPDSPFRLWMAGHSQGGAVMQVFTHRLLHQRGVMAQHMCGFGFASPTAASAALTRTPGDAPLWHILNRDDLVPRIGAQVHLGRCLEWEPTPAFRGDAYRYSTLAADQACREWMEPMLYRIQDTADNLLHVTALMLCAAEEKGDALNLLMERGRALPMMDWLYAFAGDRAQSVVKQLEAHQRRTYRELTGHEMDDRRLRALKEELRPHVVATPLRRILATLAACLSQPHQISNDDSARPGAYRQLVSQGLGRLRPFRWEMRTGSQPVKRYAAVRTGDKLRRSAPGRRERVAALRRGKGRLSRF